MNSLSGSIPVIRRGSDVRVQSVSKDYGILSLNEISLGRTSGLPWDKGVRDIQGHYIGKLETFGSQTFLKPPFLK